MHIECEIPSLKLLVELLHGTSFEEERLLYMSHLDQHRCEATMANELHQHGSKLIMIDLFTLVPSWKVIWS